MPPPPEEPTPIAGQGYQLVFEDDFLGTSLNSDVWMPRPQVGTTFLPGQVSVADSILTVSADQSAVPDFVEVWSIGQPSSPATYPRYPNAKAWKEGYFEVRARVTDDPWTKLALWFHNMEDKNIFGLGLTRKTLNAEWDMVENGVRVWEGTTGYADVNHASPVHRNTTSPEGIPDQTRMYDVDHVEAGLNDWHVWGGKWTGDTVSTYLDGVFQGSQANYDTFDQPMSFCISAAHTNSVPVGNPAKPAFMVTEVDWFRVWQRPSNARRSAVELPGTSGSYVTTPNHSSLGITGDIDVRIDVALNDWSPATTQSFIGKFAGAPQRSWEIGLRTTGAIRFTWTADGTNTTFADSTVNLTSLANGERRALRVTFDADNGASGRTTTFYTAPTIAGPWTQLGSPVTQATATSIFNGTSQLSLGAWNTTGQSEMLSGRIYAAQVRNSIDGQVVAHIDFSDKVPGVITFMDETGKLYTVRGSAKVMPGIPKPDLYIPVSPMRLA